MIIQVEMREKLDPFDYRSWKVSVPCADGSQQIRWLAYASCLRMAIINGDTPSKYVPQAIKNLDGIFLEIDKTIKECLEDGSEVVIEYTGGPKHFTSYQSNSICAPHNTPVPNNTPVPQQQPQPQPQPTEAPQDVPTQENIIEDKPNSPPPNNPPAVPITGDPNAPTLEENTPVEPTEVQIIDYSDVPILKGEFYPSVIIPSMPTTNNLDLVDWSKCGLEDATIAKAALSPHIGILQALVIWYSCQGKELEDKDFGVLNINQFVQLFTDALGEDVREKCCDLFEGMIKTKEKCAYQLTIIDFFKTIVAIASDLKLDHEDNVDMNNTISSQVENLVKLHLAPVLSKHIAQYFQDLREIRWKDCSKVLSDSKDNMALCIKICRPKGMSTSTKVVPFQVLLPRLRKWLVLEKHWSSQSLAALVISAFQGYKKDVIEFKEVPLNLDFGVKELEKLLCGASYFCQKKSTSPIKVSNKSYLEEYLKAFFVRAGANKPPYTTYEEKKDYLRSMLIKKDDYAASMLQVFPTDKK